jgi:thiol-disulfide isomerase/thioredoxin
MFKLPTKFIFCCFWILSFTTTIAQEVTVRAQFNQVPQPGTKVILEYIYGQEWKQIEMKALDGNGKVSFIFTPPSQGQYRFRFPTGKNATTWSDFLILSKPQEPTSFEFTIDYNSMKGNPLVVANSKENSLYYPLMSQFILYDDLRQATPKNQTAIHDAQVKNNALVKKTAAENKGSFVGDIVADLVYQPLREDYPSDKTEDLNDSLFYARYGISKLPYYETGALNHNLFIRSLERYFKHFQNDKNSSYAIDFIDGVMTRSGGLEEVDQFLFKYLLDKMLGYKNEEGLTYLISHYAQDCTEGHENATQTDQLVKSLQAVEPGKKAWPLTLPDINANKISLLETCKKNDLTLILFWKSSCNHCEEFKPILKGIYDRYHSKGLEVYAISIDKTEEDWSNYVKAHPQPWKDVFLSYAVRREFNNHYPVPSTPTLIALDKDGKVVSRLIVRSKLEEFVQEELTKK